MGIIKEYLKGIVEDENQINDFFETNEQEIKEFFKNLWNKQFETEVETKVEAEAETKVEAETETKVEVEAETETKVEVEVEAETKVEAEAEAETETKVEITTENQQTDMPIILDFGAKPNMEKVKHDALTFEIKNKQITFMNGKVNQPYCIDFDVEDLKIPEIAEIYFDGLEAIGLQYIPKEKKITGIPTQAGDHKVEMKFKRKDWTEGKPLLSRNVIFIINPDPKVLWSKNILTPKDIEYYKDDSDKDFVKAISKEECEDTDLGEYPRLEKAEIARKDMVAASQRGRSHAIEGKPRDDDFALYFDKETECYIMTVADGAGSAKYSRKGSQIACTVAMAICKEKLHAHKEEILKYNTSENKIEIGKVLQDTISNAVFEAYKAIENEAQDKKYLMKDFATTLILSICKKFEYGWFIGAWWVGDGGIGIYRKEPEYLKILGEPDGGEFAGQTRFLTMPNIIKNELYDRMKFEIVEDFTALILMTDGITDPKFETDANLSRIEKWHAFWDDLNGNNEDNVKVDFTDGNEQSAEQLLKWLDFWSKGNHDDRTIAILF